MSSPEDRDIEPFDWFSRFFGTGGRRRGEGFFGFPDIFRGFDDMRREMERGFEDTFKNIQAKAPKDLKSPFNIGTRADFFTKPLISSEREPLADITTTDKDVKVVVEIPGVRKENIKINVYDNSLEITSTGTEERKYREVIEIPPEADIETATSTYKNGILEIVFKKKEQSKPKGRQINID